MSKKIEGIVEGIVKPVIEDMGYEYVDCEYVKVSGDMQLIIYIYSEKGITVDDCEAVSVKIDPLIDEKDPIAEPYILVVSSPDLDRPLKSARDFERNYGSDVDVKLYSKLDGKKEYTGELIEFNGEEVRILFNGKEKAFKMSDVATVKLTIDFSGLN